jgi:hypothetical protein
MAPAQLMCDEPAGEPALITVLRWVMVVGSDGTDGLAIQGIVI